jgi:hypothetical protein
LECTVTKKRRTPNQASPKDKTKLVRVPFPWLGRKKASP